MKHETDQKSERARKIQQAEHEWDTAASASEDSGAIKRWLRLAKELFEKDEDPKSNAA